MRKSLSLAALLLALVMLGSVLRMHQLAGKSLWSDELFSASLTLYHPLQPGPGGLWFERKDLFHISDADTFWTAKAADQSPPLFELLTKLSVTLLGPTDFAMRLPSALAGILLLLSFAGFAWQAPKPDRSPLIWTLLLLTLSPGLIEYAQEARAYGLGVLFAGWLTYAWYRRWQQGLMQSDTPAWWEIAAFILACHTHYNLIIFSGLLLLNYGYFALRRRDWAALLRLVVVPLACLPWVALSLHTILFTSGGGIGWEHMGRLEACYRSAWGLVGLSGLYWLCLIASLCVAAWICTCWKSRQWTVHASPPLLAIIALLLAYLLPVSQLAAHSGVFHPRHFIYLLPATYLAAGLLLSRLRPWPVSALAAVGLGLIAASSLRDLYLFQKEPYRAALTTAVGLLPSQAPVLSTAAGNRNLYRYYLEAAENTGDTHPLLSISTPEEAPSVCQQVQNAAEVGVVAHISHRPLVDAAYTACSGFFILKEDTVFYGSDKRQALIMQHWRRRN